MEPEKEILIEQTLIEPASNSSTLQSEDNFPNEGLFVVPLLFLFIFSVAFLKQSNIIQALYHRIVALKLSTQIPCFKCQFFKQNQYLQCAVQPCLVLSKEAIHCPDFQSNRGNF